MIAGGRVMVYLGTKKFKGTIIAFLTTHLMKVRLDTGVETNVYTGQCKKLRKKVKRSECPA
jgi:hypothetical protein